MAAAALPASDARRLGVPGDRRPRSPGPGVLPEGLVVRRLLEGVPGARPYAPGAGPGRNGDRRRTSTPWRRRPRRAAVGHGGARAAAPAAASTARTSSGGSGACCASPTPTTGRRALGAAERIAELTEARELLLAVLGPRAVASRGGRRAEGEPSPRMERRWPNPPVHVTVTGAAGQIGYALVHRVAHGDLLGPDQPIVLRLLEIEPALPALEGVVMELEDGAHPLLEGIEATADLKTRVRRHVVVPARRIGPPQGGHGAPRPAHGERRDLQAAGPGHQRPRRRATCASSSSATRATRTA